MTASTFAAAPIVTIFGGSGFVGRHLAQEMARRGWRVRVAVRRPNEAMFTRPYGEVGQVEPIAANIRDENSVRAAIRGAKAVVNCVGLLAEDKYQKFQNIQVESAERIARIAAAEGVEQLVQMSAIGADANSDSQYGRTKAQGETAVRDIFPAAVVLRPSIIFGPEDQFFNKFAEIAKISPVLPVVEAPVKFQPVYVKDVAFAAAQAVEGKAKPGIYELGGPRVYSFRELMEWMLKEVNRRRIIADLPAGPAKLVARVSGLVQKLSLGIIKAQITVDQVKMLGHDNIVSEGAMSFKDLGIEPATLESVVPAYLYAHRPQGQYDAITASANELK